MRKKIVAGNWKMNTILREGVSLASDINKGLKDFSLREEVEVIIAPPFTHLTFVKQVIDNDNIKVSAQNCAAEDKGAYTGEVSAEMLKMLGCGAVILGHSERRAYYNETSETLFKKVNQALANNLTPIFCCGEMLEQREAGNHFNIVETQISDGLFHLSESDFAKVVIAYEPVWAIGTGVTASKEQAQEMHEFIRKIVKTKYGNNIAENLTILYGGSVKPSNAKEIFAQPDVDGGLIGGASLNAESFIDIIKAI
ncbi:MAG: triose-phosphate isomerase [Bacteroidales bacterium]|nr:triose-phosphate isomerase [Bacteroidales bacterium]